jgi:hypothetical protein
MFTCMNRLLDGGNAANASAAARAPDLASLVPRPMELPAADMLKG